MSAGVGTGRIGLGVAGRVFPYFRADGVGFL